MRERDFQNRFKLYHEGDTCEGDDDGDNEGSKYNFQS